MGEERAMPPPTATPQAVATTPAAPPDPVAAAPVQQPQSAAPATPSAAVPACAAHPACVAAGHGGAEDCCPTTGTGVMMSCCGGVAQKFIEKQSSVVDYNVRLQKPYAMALGVVSIAVGMIFVVFTRRSLHIYMYRRH